MKRLLAILMLILSSIIFSKENYEILPITKNLQGIQIVRITEGENIGLYGIINSKKEFLTEADNILISVQKNHIYLVNTEYQEGLMTTNGEWIANMEEYSFKDKYSNMYKASDEEKDRELFIVYINEMPGHKYGYLNYDGELQIPIVYEDAENFSEGLAAVKLNGKWGYIDEEGNVKIGFNFDEAYEFKDGLTLVRIDDDFFYIDKTGQKQVMKTIFRRGSEKIKDLRHHIGSSLEGKFRIKQKLN